MRKQQSRSQALPSRPFLSGGGRWRQMNLVNLRYQSKGQPNSPCWEQLDLTWAVSTLRSSQVGGTTVLIHTMDDLGVSFVGAGGREKCDLHVFVGSTCFNISHVL